MVPKTLLPLDWEELVPIRDGFVLLGLRKVKPRPASWLSKMLASSQDMGVH